MDFLLPVSTIKMYCTIFHWQIQKLIMSPQGEPKTISYYDKDNNRKKQIDLDKLHQGVLPHTLHGYNHRENDGAKGYGNLTNKEKAMVERVIKIWEEKKDVIWTRWKNRK